MWRIIAIVLLLFDGIGACFGGFQLVVDPTGSSLQFSQEWLNTSTSPFQTYLIPGVILLVVNGLGNILVAVMAWIRVNNYQDLVILIGTCLSVWIASQMIILQVVHWLQFVYFAIGLMIVIAGILDKRKSGS